VIALLVCPAVSKDRMLVDAPKSGIGELAEAAFEEV